MSRRVRLPGADELVRPTSAPDGSPPEFDDQTRDDQTRDDQTRDDQTRDVESPDVESPDDGPADHEPDTSPRPRRASRRSTGRVRHDEKLTVYLSADELFALEQARLSLRRELGSAVDRGRVVREAVALALADLEERGAESALARRLRRQ